METQIPKIPAQKVSFKLIRSFKEVLQSQNISCAHTHCCICSSIQIPDFIQFLSNKTGIQSITMNKKGSKCEVMKHQLTKLNAMLLFCLVSAGLYAQEAIPASGGNAKGSGGSVSYTFGQVFYTSNTGSNGSVAKGVQQPYEISVVTGKNEPKGINLACTIFPNPVNDFVKLVVENYNIRNMIYELYDNSGKIIESQKVVGNETRIDMSKLIVAPYFLKVSINNKEIKTFKIVKY
jgi:hypothetical protein